MKKPVLLTALLLLYALSYSQSYWNNVASGTTKDLLSVSFGNPVTGYIGGKDSLLLQTTDGGHSWQKIVLPDTIFSPARKDVVDVFFVSAGTGYITLALYPQSYNSRVYKTTDGGNTWSWLHTGDAVPLRCHFSGDGKGYIAGSTFYKGYAVARVEQDTIASSHVFSANPYPFFRAVDFRNSNVGIVAGDSGLVCRTFNGGIDWDTLRTTMGHTINALHFLSHNVVLAASENSSGSLLLSTDTGRTWNVDFSSLTFDYPVMKAVAYSSKDSFIAVGASTTTPGKGMIYWRDPAFNRFWSADHPLHSVALSDDSFAYAVGEQGLIVTNKPAVLSVGAPTRLQSLLKLYPNPAFGSCNTELPVKHTLKVYDISGRLVAQYDNPALKQVIRLEGRAAGPYWIDIITAAGTLHTKMILR